VYLTIVGDVIFKKRCSLILISHAWHQIMACRVSPVICAKTTAPNGNSDTHRHIAQAWVQIHDFDLTKKTDVGMLGMKSGNTDQIARGKAEFTLRSLFRVKSSLPSVLQFSSGTFTSRATTRIGGQKGRTSSTIADY